MGMGRDAKRGAVETLNVLSPLPVALVYRGQWRVLHLSSARAAGEARPRAASRHHYQGYGEIIFEHACKLGCEGIVSKRLGSPYRSGRSPHWLKIKNPAAPAVKREAEEDCRR